MKIQLERKLPSCPERLTCAVCCQPFAVAPIRLLLFTDQGLLRGDVCSHCQHLSSSSIRETLRERAILLKRQSELQSPSTITIHQLASELMICSQEAVQFPSLVQWWHKWWEIWTDQSAAGETAQWALTTRYDRQLHHPLQWPTDDRSKRAGFEDSRDS